jgi:hypothetical protein
MLKVDCDWQKKHRLTNDGFTNTHAAGMSLNGLYPVAAASDDGEGKDKDDYYYCCCCCCYYYYYYYCYYYYDKGGGGGSGADIKHKKNVFQ